MVYEGSQQALHFTTIVSSSYNPSNFAGNNKNYILLLLTFMIAKIFIKTNISTSVFKAVIQKNQSYTISLKYSFYERKLDWQCETMIACHSVQIYWEKQKLSIDL